ncbi:MAG TPA: heparinase II/III family protein [bacterium]|nr:heparinase II/III family protein [bacterium]
MYSIESVEKIKELISEEALTEPVILREDEIREDIPEERIIELCEEIVKSPIPEARYSFFREFYITGNRTHYESPHNLKRTNMYLLALGVFLTEREDFLLRLQDYIWDVCNEVTWCYPAHLPEELNYNEPYIDLFASMTAEQLAEILDLLGERLDRNIRERINFELKRRIFVPFCENPDRYWWANSYWSNWCAVCCGAIGASSIAGRAEEPYFSKILFEVIQRLNRYLDCFDDEGGWVEGIGYWNFGLTHLTRFADSLYRITDGRINIFEHPKLQVTGIFPIHCYLPPDTFVNFGDCSYDVALNRDLVMLLSSYTSPGKKLNWLSSQIKMRELENFRCLRKKDTREMEIPKETSIHFSGIDWVITRRSWEDRLGPVLAVKAGNNGEPHNQIDVGHFIFYVYGQQFLHDLGSGIYTKDYFREGRYKSPFCNAEGHSLIFIDGESEGVGEEFKGKIVSFESGIDEDRIVIDLTKAYPSENVRNITRTLYFLKDRIDGQLILEDSVSLNRDSKIASRIQINGEIEQTGEKSFIIKGKYGNLYADIKEPLDCKVEVGELSNLEFHDGTVRSFKFLDIVTYGRDARFRIIFTPFRDRSELE